jgi:DnaJ-class molecular chaperone
MSSIGPSPCVTCGGTGSVKCYQCDGSGKVTGGVSVPPVSYPVKVPCLACLGQGKIR